MLVAVHLGSVLTPPAVALGFVLMVVMLAWSMHRVRDEELTRLGVMSAAFFVASLVHVKLGVVSVHLILSAVVGLRCGRRAPAALVTGLVLQSLLFAHGSPDSLGVNAVVLCGPALLARPLRGMLGRLPPMAAGVVVGVVVSLLTVTLSALALRLGGEDSVRGAAWLAWAVNSPVVVLEGLVTGLYLRLESLTQRRATDSG